MLKQVDWRQRFLQLKEISAQPLEQKIERARELLSFVCREHKRPIIAWSGGKDSTVLLHMALSQNTNIDVVWIDTGVEFPECKRFIKDLKVRWSLNLHIARPETTFWKVVEEFGWPMLGKGGNGSWRSRAAYLERKGKAKLAKAVRDARISAACCRLLKKNPCEKLYRKLEIDCVVLGNMVAESRQRFLNWSNRGDYYYAPSEGRYKVWPIAAWNDSDVWEYHSLFGLPHSQIYDKGHRRNGCWPCLMDIRFHDNKLRTLRLSHPKLWHFLIVNKGLGRRLLALKLALSEKEDMVPQDNWLDQNIKMLVKQRPCYFDQI